MYAHVLCTCALSQSITANIVTTRELASRYHLTVLTPAQPIANIFLFVLRCLFGCSRVNGGFRRDKLIYVFSDMIHGTIYPTISSRIDIYFFLLAPTAIAQAAHVVVTVLRVESDARLVAVAVTAVGTLRVFGACIFIDATCMQNTTVRALTNHSRK